MGLLHLTETLAIHALALSFAHASDPSPLQDLCVAAKDPNAAGCSSKIPLMSKRTTGTRNSRKYIKSSHVKCYYGKCCSNTGIEHSWRLFSSYRPCTIRTKCTPHILELARSFFVVEGTLYVGFVTSNSENRFIYKVLQKSDVFVFPRGLIHFQFNIGHTNVVAFAGLSSQNPCVITIGNAVFWSESTNL